MILERDCRNQLIWGPSYDHCQLFSLCIFKNIVLADKIDRIQHESIMAYFKALSSSSEENEGKKETSHFRRHMCRDLN
jgi:hypothetical protein